MVCAVHNFLFSIYIGILHTLTTQTRKDEKHFKQSFKIYSMKIPFPVCQQAAVSFQALILCGINDASRLK